MSNLQAPSLTDIPRPSGPWEYADAEEGYEYIVSTEPNMMRYIDDAGNRHEIHIPTGRGAEAREHFVKKSWTELARFPKWEGQRYTDNDYTITKYKKNPTTDVEKEGIVVKKAGEPLVKTPGGKVVLSGKEGNVGK